MKVHALCHIMNSKADMYGNRYWAVTWTNVNTGKSVSFRVDSGSNAETIYRAFGLSWDSVIHTYQELGIRDFNRKVKGWPYFGCTGEEMSRNIKKALKGVSK